MLAALLARRRSRSAPLDEAFGPMPRSLLGMPVWGDTESEPGQRSMSMRGSVSVWRLILALGHCRHQLSMVLRSVVPSSRPCAVRGCSPGEGQSARRRHWQTPWPSVHQSGKIGAASRALARAASRRVFMSRRPCGVAAQTSGCRGSQRSQETVQNLGCWGDIVGWIPVAPTRFILLPSWP